MSIYRTWSKFTEPEVRTDPEESDELHRIELAVIFQSLLFKNKMSINYSH